MPIDGHYNLTLETPVGAQQGKMTLHTQGETLSGTLENDRGRVEFEGGTVSSENAVAFATRIPTPIGKLKAHVTGKVEGDHFHGTAKLPLGSAKIDGYRVK